MTPLSRLGNCGVVEMSLRSIYLSATLNQAISQTKTQKGLSDLRFLMLKIENFVKAENAWPGTSLTIDDANTMFNLAIPKLGVFSTVTDHAERIRRTNQMTVYTVVRLLRKKNGSEAAEDAD